MKYAHLVWANVMRNKLRSVFTVLGIAAALGLFCFLESVITALNAGVDVASASRLVTRNAVSLVQPLPMAYKNKLLQMDGIEDVTYQNWFGGQYEKDRTEFFAQFAVDAESFLRVYPEYSMSQEERESFLAERDACLVGRKLADRLGLSVGDPLVLKGSIYPGQWEFNVRGIYTTEEESVNEATMFFHFDYLDQGRPEGSQGQVGVYILALEDPNLAPRVQESIDTSFENSSSATRTETEAAFAASFVSMFGNVSLLLRSIGAAVVFTLLMVAANTMMMTARERMAEVGILKTLGYPAHTLFSLIIAESMVLALMGGVLGCGLMFVMFMGGNVDFQGFFPGFRVPLLTVAAGMGVAFATGVISGLVPAMTAVKLEVTDALRRV